MPPNEAAADLLTLRQAAEKLDCHPDTIRRAIREGRIASQKVRGKFGAEWRVSAAAVGDYIRANTPGHDMSDAVQGSLSPVLAGPISDLMRDMQALAEALHRAHRAQPTPEDLAAEAEAQHRRDQVVADIADRVSEHPQVHDLIAQVAALRRDLAARDREIVRLEEELAAERRTTWWQRLISAVWRGRASARPS